MYCIVELDGSVSLVANGKGLALSGPKEVREAIKELTDVLFELNRLGFRGVCHDTATGSARTDVGGDSQDP